MDDPFDKNGSISETARIVFDTDNYLAVLSQAKAGDADAQYQLGLWYHEGGNEAVEQDLPVADRLAKAAEWFRKSADQGHEEAVVKLAKLGERSRW